MNVSSTTCGIITNDPLFMECSRQMLARFLPHITEHTVEPGEHLENIGAPAKNTFYVVHGSFEVWGEGNRTTIVTDGFLGEEAAIGMDAYVATVTAREPSKVLVMPKHAMSDLATDRPVRQALLVSFSNRFSSAPPDTNIDDSLLESIVTSSVSPRHLIGWVVTSLAPFIIYFSLQNAGLPSEQALYLLSILGTTISMWVFRLLPDFVPAIFAILSIALLNLTPSEIMLSGFSSNTFFMALSIFGLSALIITSGLSLRILLWLLLIGPPHKAWYYLSLFLSGMALTPVVPTSNGRISIVAPFMNDLLNIFDKASAQAEAPRLAAAVVGGTSLLSAIFLSSKSVNFLVFGLLPRQEQEQFQWLDWFFAASVCGAVMIVLYFCACWVLFRNTAKPTIPKNLISDQLNILGPMAVSEWGSVIGLLILLISFITTSVHHIAVPWIALAILFSILMFGFLEKTDFRNRIDWSFLIFLAALIGLVASMKHVGLDTWITANLGWLNSFMENDFNLFILVLSLSIFLVRLTMPTFATVVIFATLLIPTAVNLGVNPWLVGFIILLMSETFIWPYQATYYSLFCSITGDSASSNDKRIMTLHALTFGIKLVAIYVSLPYWRMLGIL